MQITKRQKYQLSKKDKTSEKVKNFKEGLWQYLIDHASVADDKMYRISFHTYGPDDFWHRVNARKNGLYSRRDQEEFEQKAVKLRQRREKHSLRLKAQTKQLNKLYHGSEEDRQRAEKVKALLAEANRILYDTTE